MFEKERWPIFGSAWIHVAYEHQLRRTGDYVTENLAGWPIFVRRTDDGELRGLLQHLPAPRRPDRVGRRGLSGQHDLPLSRLGVPLRTARCSTPATSAPKCPRAWT